MGNSIPYIAEQSVLLEEKEKNDCTIDDGKEKGKELMLTTDIQLNY